MSKLRFLVFSFLFILIPNIIWACPNCAGSSSGSRDKFTVVILAVFIILTYIPFYMIFRMIFKNRKITDGTGPAA